MTVSLDKFEGSVSVQQSNSAAVSAYSALAADKLIIHTSVAQANMALVSQANGVIVDKMIIHTSVAQANMALVSQANGVIVDKLYATVAVFGPVRANGVTTCTGTATGIGSRLFDTVGVANATSSAQAITVTQYTMLPVEDTDPGLWKNQDNALPLYPSIAKYVPTVNDATHIKGEPDSIGDTARFKLSPSLFANSANPVLTYRYNKYPQLTITTVDLVVTLQQNTTNVATWNHTGITSAVFTASQTLTAPQAASITDYDDLYVVFTSKAYPIA